jgi:cytosine/creatinine deaminase
MNKFMEAAFDEAKKSRDEGGIPIGAILVYNNKIAGRGHNKRVQQNSTILHAEMDCFENAGRHPASFYKQCTLYTTLSPCRMCTGTVLFYGIPHIVIGENKTFIGEEKLLSSQGVKVEVLQNQKCIEIMTEFCNKYPEIWNEDIAVS